MARTRTRTTQMRRKRSWARSEFVTVPSAGGDAVDLLGDFRTELGVGANPPGLTVGGVLLDLVVTQTSARAADGDHAALGLIVTSETVLGEVEAPLADPHADWMWYQMFGAHGAIGDTRDTFDSLGGPIRIRSKRRMDEIGMNLFLSTQLSGLTTFQITGIASVLLLLP